MTKAPPAAARRLTDRQIGDIAWQALIDEVEATPKPGLVDQANSGAHTDMDYNTFVASANALRPHFAAFARAGAQTFNMEEPEAFAHLRGLGLLAEEDMFCATGGVNTHKGAVFSIGLLCGAAGRLGAQGHSLSPICLCRTVARMTHGLCRRDMARLSEKPRHTAGERMFLKYGVLGARGEAESGFENARRHGYARLCELLKKGQDKNTAYVRTLLSLMANVTDTNVLARHDMDTAMALKSRASTLHRRYSAEGVVRLDSQLTAQNISPGGSADLLAVSIFLYLLRSASAGE